MVSLNLQALPWGQQNLILFVSDLALTSSFNNVKVHLSAVKFFSLANNASFQKYNRHYLTMCRIKQAHWNKFKKPKLTQITPNILKEIQIEIYLTHCTHSKTNS